MVEHSDLELAFHEAMLNVYRSAKEEAKYSAIVFLGWLPIMVALMQRGG